LLFNIRERILGLNLFERYDNMTGSSEFQGERMPEGELERIALSGVSTAVHRGKMLEDNSNVVTRLKEAVVELSGHAIEATEAPLEAQGIKEQGEQQWLLLSTLAPVISIIDTEEKREAVQVALEAAALKLSTPEGLAEYQTIIAQA
jgi:hypothetical protein